MGDRTPVILEKSRTVRRRYQRRKQQVVFSKAELERLERAEERDRRAKKLQEKEKRRIANKKKRLEKEAIEREERKKSGLPDPNARIPASQQLLSNFFGKKGGFAGDVREKSGFVTLIEEEGDTEVDGDNDCESDRSTSPDEGLDRGETEEMDSDDSFDDDDALTLFNDENVLKRLDEHGNAKECLEKHTTKEPPGLTTSGGSTSSEKKIKPQVLPDQASGSHKEAEDRMPKPTNVNKDKQKHASTISVDRISKTNPDIVKSGPSGSNSGNASTKAHSTDGEIMRRPQQAPTVLYQNAEDVLAGLCSQDLADYDDDDDDNERCFHQRPVPKSNVQGQRSVSSEKQSGQPNRPPLLDLAPTSVNIKNLETNNTTSQKQKETANSTAQPQKPTTAIIDDEYGSFSFTDEDLLSLGV